MFNCNLADLENSILCQKKIFLSDKQYTHEHLYNFVIHTLSQYNKFIMKIKKYIIGKNNYIKDMENIIKGKNKIIDELSSDLSNLKLAEESFIHEIQNYSDKIEVLIRRNKEIKYEYENNYIFFVYLYFLSIYFAYNIGCNGLYNVLYSTYYVFIVSPIVYFGDIFNVIILNPMIFMNDTFMTLIEYLS